MRAPRTSLRALFAIAALVLAMAACGDSDDSSTAAPDENVDATDSGEGADDTSDPGDSTDADQPDDTDTGDSGSATATVDGVTYEFPDVRECEIDGETWGEGWRTLVAWSADGHDLLDITVGNAESESLGAPSSISIVIGTTNANTLDNANPDQEWSDLLGDGPGVTASLASDGASGTASVGQATGEKSTAEWSFTC